ncbi:sugar fermentation stimulation protein [Marinobacterium zhoushanense]|uniref:Sugar fermentation stimulation protein homolog n=1 Tax=Marinobacterium zhoushanense TaxID=1679163 RepID=A0ABQ1KI67_9GAMM|nr:DNA/RNA nuclease SfsA [Marinobacterium zhoushanense]GGB96614.1 sugar fermentation stimulation protein [Marinobacterium zhoushanense]
MIFDPPLEPVTLLRRYKRFMADVRRADGSEITVHCPNTGSMKNGVLPGQEQAALISDSGNDKRKYRHTLEAVQVAHGHWAGVNTGRSNSLVEEAIRAGLISALSPDDGVEREVRFNDSRFDLALGKRSDPHTFIEVKNVTLGPGPDDPDDGVIAFPDSVTERGQKHLQTLMQVVACGKRAVLLFCVQHSGARAFRPADEVDARYGELLREAGDSGVDVLAWKTSISAERIALLEPLDILL